MPSAGVPRIMWQPEHGRLRKTRSPSRACDVAGSRAGRSSLASHFRKASGGSAKTYIAMCACCWPQNSAHCPRYSPGWLASSRSLFTRPGIRSAFRFSSGTQKLWITSAVVPSMSTRVRTGMWISLAVTARVPGYRISHHQSWPITCTDIRVELAAGASVVLIRKRSDQTNSNESTTIGTKTPSPITIAVPARSPPPKGKLSRLRRTQPSKSRTAITPNPIEQPASITHQSTEIECSCLLAGWRAFWLSPAQAPTGNASAAAATITILAARPRLRRNPSLSPGSNTVRFEALSFPKTRI